MDIGSITVRLGAAGYDRGLLTGTFAETLKRLMTAIVAGRLDHLAAAVADNDEKEASGATPLRRIPGVGPRVIRNAWLLLRPSSSKPHT